MYYVYCYVIVLYCYGGDIVGNKKGNVIKHPLLLFD